MVAVIFRQRFTTYFISPKSAVYRFLDYLYNVFHFHEERCKTTFKLRVQCISFRLIALYNDVGKYLNIKYQFKIFVV